ncbi:MAG: clan AA aspartic protease [Pyrinomonadaceae bacterium]
MKVRTRLTNALDEELARQGQLSGDRVRAYEADAVVDTGVVHTVLPVHVVQQLGLTIRGQRVAEYADGRQDVVDVTGPFVIAINDRDTLEEALVLGDEVLIGQTALEKMDLLVDCTNRRVIPNPAHPDQPVSKIK